MNLLVSRLEFLSRRRFMIRNLAIKLQEESSLWDEPEFPLSEAFRDSMQHTESVIPAVRDLKLTWLLIHGDKSDVVLPQLKC